MCKILTHTHYILIGHGAPSLRIIIMEIYKVPTLRLKVLNKQTHILYIEKENVIKKEEDIDKGF